MRTQTTANPELFRGVPIRPDFPAAQGSATILSYYKQLRMKKIENHIFHFSSLKFFTDNFFRVFI